MPFSISAHTHNTKLVIEGGTDVLLNHFYTWFSYLDGQFHNLLCILLLADKLCVLKWQTIFKILDVFASICSKRFPSSVLITSSQEAGLM